MTSQSGARSPTNHSSAVKSRGTRRDVYSVLSKHIEGNDFKGSLISGSKNHEGRGTVVVSPQPVRGRNAPAVPRRKTREPVLEDRSA